jgi:hypothetical protein
MNDSIAPGPRRARTPREAFRQAAGLGAAVCLPLGVLGLAAPAFTERVLASPLTMRALGATLAVTGLMLVTVARIAGRGRLRLHGVLASAIGSALVAVGALKLLWPRATPPLVDAFGGRGGAVSLAAMGAVLALVTLAIPRTPPQ